MRETRQQPHPLTDPSGPLHYADRSNVVPRAPKSPAIDVDQCDDTPATLNGERCLGTEYFVPTAGEDIHPFDGETAGKPCAIYVFRMAYFWPIYGSKVGRRMFKPVSTD